MDAEQILKKWAHAPWHSWIKEEPLWLRLIAEFWARLPREALAQINAAAPELIFLPPTAHARIVRLDRAIPAGSAIVQLNDPLLSRPRDQALAILAHELAHVCVPATADELENDLQADSLATRWGFGQALLLALKSDLEPAHPRILAAARCAA